LISEFYYQATYRHQVYLERLKAEEINKVLPFLDDWRTSILTRLSEVEITDLSRQRMELLLNVIEQDLAVINNDQYALINQSFNDLAVYEAEFEASLLKETLKDFDSVIPAPAQIHAAVFTSIMDMQDRTGGKMLESFVRDWQEKEVEAYQGIVRRGFGEGQTNSQIIKQVRDEIDTSKRHASTMVRTGVQHVANQARKRVLEENGVKKYQWVSTLDSRTTPFCQRVDNMVFEYNKGPFPPAHPNCRSTTVPDFPKGFEFLRKDETRSSIGGAVSGDLDYFDWLKTQSKQMQIDALGKKRAELFQNMSKDTFIKLSYNKRFEPLTLEEMKSKQPQVFARLTV